MNDILECAAFLPDERANLRSACDRFREAGTREAALSFAESLLKPALRMIDDSRTEPDELAGVTLQFAGGLCRLAGSLFKGVDDAW